MSGNFAQKRATVGTNVCADCCCDLLWHTKRVLYSTGGKAYLTHRLLALVGRAKHEI